MADPPSAALADLDARITRFDQGGDRAAVLDAAAHQAALDLYGEVVADRVGGAGVVRVLGQWFLRHHEAHQPGSAASSLRAARMCAGLLRDLDASAVPPDLHELLNGQPDRAAAAHATAVSLLEQFEETGDPSRVVAAGELLRSVHADLPDDHRLTEAAVQLSSALLTVNADPADADVLVNAGRAALRADPGSTDTVNALAWALLVRYQLAGAADDLREALELTQRYLRDERGGLVAHVAVQRAEALRMRYESTHVTADLDQAVELARAAVELTPDGHRIADPVRQVLATCLVRRIEHLDRADDLTEAIALCAAIRPRTAKAGPTKAMWLATESALLTRRGQRSGDLSDVDIAVALAEEALALGAELIGVRPIALTNLGSALALRYILRGDSTDLPLAISRVREAIAATRSGDTRLAALHAQLTTLSSLAAADGHRGTGLDEAIRHGEQALARFEPGHAQRITALNALGQAHRQRFMAEGTTPDLLKAIALWREAAATSTGNAGARLAAARAWLGSALRLRDLPGASEAATAAIRLLPIVAERGLDRAGQERRLAGVAGLAGEAAALAVHIGRPEHAVELAEQGRTVLWRHVVQTRGDLSPLRAVAPDLADRMEGTRRALTAAADDPGAAERHRRLAERWGQLLADARRLPGLGTFLGTSSFDELRLAATGGTVVLVNLSPARCDALLVRPDGVRVVPLPWLRHEDARRRADALLGATVDLRPALVSMLRWLWDTTAGPVVAALDELDGPVRHRVWWCPTGPMAMLPLHAAGRYSTSQRVARRTVPDRTLSSYTTDLGALIRSRRARPPVSPRLLTVGVASRPGRAPLPAVLDEVRRISATVPGTTTLLGPAATPEVVLAELPAHPWVHFACHATQNLDHPGESALHLHNGDLTVLRLAAHDLTNAELAYLSACDTAAGALTLADETVHLAAALQLAGFRHVIATQWPVSDTVAASVADSVYRRLLVNGGLRASDAAHALAETTAELRAKYPDQPDTWAPFVHIGP
ncbi:tetratricopeptide (TPR) repeat protein [Actinokineospora baliensis]|uniref:CHAT domain-containing protein n=1 Tax=Actinokineospora baliensis TaxID=547056 RepID=UPI001959D83A|nr:CHAT domain-containing protein [Actinokineospora baliensis]MBM7775032.1 tetratricopeptide (TPR) repeat protein [Actinokineospora baliensis]